MGGVVWHARDSCSSVSARTSQEYRAGQRSGHFTISLVEMVVQPGDCACISWVAGLLQNPLYAGGAILIAIVGSRRMCFAAEHDEVWPGAWFSEYSMRECSSMPGRRDDM